MIPIIFISLCIAWFLFRHFENKRMDRVEEQQEKRKEAYQHLLNLLKKKEENYDTQSNEE